MDRLDHCNDQMELIKAGGCAEGFRIRGSDVDHMIVDKLTKVVAEIPKNFGSFMTVVRMRKTPDEPPGYVKLIVLTPLTPLVHIRESMQKIRGDYYLSSEAFMKWFQRQNPVGDLHGPCVLERTEDGDHDRSFCLQYKDWPVFANEWIERKRAYEWPSNELKIKIKTLGCHLMAIGSKKLNTNFHSVDTVNSVWIGDPLQWRISFSLAEKHLVYSFNNTQFLTYGIFKLLNQEVFSQDSIIKNCICSYFLKTVLFWTVEETPSDCWKPERLVYCVDICFQKLIEWTKNGFCPNYFIRDNNMFLGKVQECELGYISSKLNDLHKKGWRCLLSCPSLFVLKKALEDARKMTTPFSLPIFNPEEDFRCLKTSLRDADNTHAEANLDYVLFGEILSKKPQFPTVQVLEFELRKSISLEIQENLDPLDLDILRLRRYQTLYDLALVYLNISMTKHTTRSKYAFIRKAFCYLHLVRFSDISRGNLTLATAFYCIGRFESALEYIKDYDDINGEGLGRVYIPFGSGNVYNDPNYHKHFCGRGLSIMEKMSLAVSYDFVVHRSMPLIPIEIALEVTMMRRAQSRLVIPLELYSVFLKILCHTYLRNLKLVEHLATVLENTLQRTPNAEKYLKYIMLAVTSVKLGKYEKAMRYYCLAHIYKRRLVIYYPDRPEWQSRTSVLFYIAQMLRNLMPV